MELKILEERPNPLLQRTDYTFEIAHATSATPTRDLARTEVAKAVHVPKDRVVIERMHAKFGTAKTVGEASAYTSKEAVESTVREHILIRNGIHQKAEKVAPGAAAPEPPKPEPPKAEPPKKAETPKAEPSKKSDAPKTDAKKPETAKGA
ncbi:MAG: 30S ribosomal protein S24e [Thermoplasmata archaeon]|nr:30S ribosomal protein S24e [Thermoplasmata archaeon]